jgi:hypothetical protein
MNMTRQVFNLEDIRWTVAIDDNLKMTWVAEIYKLPIGWVDVTQETYEQPALLAKVEEYALANYEQEGV